MSDNNGMKECSSCKSIRQSYGKQTIEELTTKYNILLHQSISDMRYQLKHMGIPESCVFEYWFDEDQNTDDAFNGCQDILSEIIMRVTGCDRHAYRTALSRYYKIEKKELIISFDSPLAFSITKFSLEWSILENNRITPIYRLISSTNKVPAIFPSVMISIILD
jgi:hypothetical protein